MVTVRTPVAGSNDVVGSVAFRDGAAQVDETTQAAELRYFRAAGYVVEEIPADEPLVDSDGDGAPDMPRGNASQDTWREYAVATGMAEEQANSMSRDEIVAHFKKEAGQ